MATDGGRKKSNVHIPRTSNVVGRSSSFLFGNQKGLFSETNSKSELQGGYMLGSPPHTGFKKNNRMTAIAFWNPKTKPWGRPFSRYDVSQGISPKITVPSLKLTAKALKIGGTQKDMTSIFRSKLVVSDPKPVVSTQVPPNRNQGVYHLSRGIKRLTCSIAPKSSWRLPFIHRSDRSYSYYNLNGRRPFL